MTVQVLQYSPARQGMSSDGLPSSVLAQLKQEISYLKASCLQLASRPTCTADLAKLEREVQQARREYDVLLDRRRKQAAELEDLFTSWQNVHQASASAKPSELQADNVTQHRSQPDIPASSQHQTVYNMLTLHFRSTSALLVFCCSLCILP